MIKYGFQDISYEGITNTDIPSVMMGNGSVRITTVMSNECGYSGVSLAPAPNNRVVGCDFIVDSVPKDPDEDVNWTAENARMQLFFDNPKSIDVLIARLNEAKDWLVNSDKKTNPSQ